MVGHIALMFFILSGYSAGAVSSGGIKPRGQSNLAPSCLDTLIAGGLWVGSVLVRPRFAGRWASSGVALAVAFAAGFIFERLQRQDHEDNVLPQ